VADPRCSWTTRDLRRPGPGQGADRLEVAVGITGEDLQAQALASDKISAALVGKVVRKVIVRPPTLVNIVAT